MTTTTVQRPTTHDPYGAPERTPRRKAMRVAVAAVALSIGVAAVYITIDATADSPRSEWTSEDGLRWEHPDGRSYVVATPQTIGGR